MSKHNEKDTHEHENKESDSRMDGVKKWMGLIAGVLSFGSAVFGVVKAQGDMNDRAKVVVEQLAAGELQQKAGDYPNAWESYERAAKAADADGPIATLLGGSGKSQEKVQKAQEDLAMEWARKGRTTTDQPFSAVADRLIPVLSAGVTEATGGRKADLLAHLGWAAYLKQRDGDGQVQPQRFFSDSVAADAKNPYGNAFWGVYLLQRTNRSTQSGALAEAQQHFAAALSSGREHAMVRELQVRALFQAGSDEAEAAWWQTMDEMRRNGEPIDAASQREMVRAYLTAPNTDDQVRRLFTLLPPAAHVELARMLLRSGRLDARERLSVQANMAMALDAAGHQDQSVTAWREVKAGVQPDTSYNFATRMNAALKTISAHPGKGH